MCMQKHFLTFSRVLRQPYMPNSLVAWNTPNQHCTNVTVKIDFKGKKEILAAPFRKGLILTSLASP